MSWILKLTKKVKGLNEIKVSSRVDMYKQSCPMTNKEVQFWSCQVFLNRPLTQFVAYLITPTYVYIYLTNIAMVIHNQIKIERKASSVKVLLLIQLPSSVNAIMCFIFIHKIDTFFGNKSINHNSVSDINSY